MNGADARLVNSNAMENIYISTYSRYFLFFRTFRNPSAIALPEDSFIMLRFLNERHSVMRNAPIRRTIARTMRLQKIPRQPPINAMRPPTIGAATVAMPLTAAMIDIIDVNSRPLYLSAAILLESTTPPAPEIPWKRRITTN